MAVAVENAAQERLLVRHATQRGAQLSKAIKEAHTIKDVHAAQRGAQLSKAIKEAHAIKDVHAAQRGAQLSRFVRRALRAPSVVSAR